MFNRTWVNNLPKSRLLNKVSMNKVKNVVFGDYCNVSMNKVKNVVFGDYCNFCLAEDKDNLKG